MFRSARRLARGRTRGCAGRNRAIIIATIDKLQFEFRGNLVACLGVGFLNSLPLDFSVIN